MPINISSEFNNFYSKFDNKQLDAKDREQLTQLIKDNLKTLSDLKEGEKLVFGADGKINIDQSYRSTRAISGTVSYYRGDDYANIENLSKFVEITDKFFQETPLIKEGQNLVDTDIPKAIKGLNNLKKTYETQGKPKEDNHFKVLDDAAKHLEKDKELITENAKVGKQDIGYYGKYTPKVKSEEPTLSTDEFNKFMTSFAFEGKDLVLEGLKNSQDENTQALAKAYTELDENLKFLEPELQEDLKNEFFFNAAGVIKDPDKFKEFLEDTKNLKEKLEKTENLKINEKIEYQKKVLKESKQFPISFSILEQREKLSQENANNVLQQAQKSAETRKAYALNILKIAGGLLGMYGGAYYLPTSMAPTLLGIFKDVANTGAEDMYRQYMEMDPKEGAGVIKELQKEGKELMQIQLGIKKAPELKEGEKTYFGKKAESGEKVQKQIIEGEQQFKENVKMAKKAVDQFLKGKEEEKDLPETGATDSSGGSETELGSSTDTTDTGNPPEGKKEEK